VSKSPSNTATPSYFIFYTACGDVYIPPEDFIYKWVSFHIAYGLDDDDNIGDMKEFISIFLNHTSLFI
jgi:hypothetical protein